MHVLPMLMIVLMAPTVVAPAAVGAATHATEPSPHKHESAATAIRKIEGVYKSRFANSTVHQETFESENILEIVPYKNDTIYFRIHLEFYNAHLCNLQGIARYEDGKFTYHGTGDSDSDICILTITPGQNGVTLDDRGGNCRALTCGARGGYRGIRFSLTSRRVIRYMKRLRASREYAAAVEEFEKSPKH